MPTIPATQLDTDGKAYAYPNAMVVEVVIPTLPDPGFYPAVQATFAARDTAVASADAAEESADAADADRVTVAADKVTVAADRVTTTAAKVAAEAARDAAAASAALATGLLIPALNKRLVSASDIIDVAVYDAAADSDAGYWRRARGASWYNETLNTATRGTRAGFPKRTAIVLRSGTPALSIFDLDTLDVSGVPTLWKIINTAAGGLIDGVPTSVFALNGRIYVTTSTGLYRYNFALDTASRFDANGRYQWSAGIAGSGAWILESAAAALGATSCLSVHARALAGAPLDSAGIAVPTVAVGTTAGTSVILGNGTVYDITVASGYDKVMFASDARLWLSPAATGTDDLVEFGGIPSADVANSTWRSGYYRAANVAGYSLPLPRAIARSDAMAPGGIGTQIGLALMSEDVAVPANGMVSHIAVLYATGWMPGDCRLATLGDNDSGSVSGAAIMASDGTSTTGWVPPGTNTVASVSGELEITYQNNAIGADYTLTGLTVGRTYFLRGKVRRGTSANARLQVIADATANLDNNTTAYVGEQTAQFTAIATTATIRVSFTGTPIAGNTIYIDDVSVLPAPIDRSPKARPLNIAGTLTRAPVSNGNDLQGWSGFSVSNYLEQPYSADLSFGTTDFMVAAWVKASTLASQTLFERAAASAGVYTATPAFRIGMAADGSVSATTSSDGFATTTAVSSAAAVIAAGAWHLIVVARRSGTLEVWVDGNLVASGASAATLTNAAAVFRAGLRVDGSSPATTAAVSLLRVSAYAPTAAQIAKMTRDERTLFEPGAKAFLAGTSNAVADLDYDDSRDSLIVGTADGISEFVGLRRRSYRDTVSNPLLTNDNMKAVGARQGFVLGAGGADLLAVRDATLLVDEFRAAAPVDRAKTSAPGTVASAAVVDLGTIEADLVTITGTTAITSFGTGTNQRKTTVFTSALTLTHNATSLINKGGGNITTAAGDVAQWVSDAVGNWRMASYMRAAGAP